MPTFGKRTPLTESHFADFEQFYNTEDRKKLKDKRASVFSRDEIKKKGESLDLGLIADDSLTKQDDLPEPEELGAEILTDLANAQKLMDEILAEL